MRAALKTLLRDPRVVMLINASKRAHEALSYPTTLAKAARTAEALSLALAPFQTDEAPTLPELPADEEGGWLG